MIYINTLTNMHTVVQLLHITVVQLNDETYTTYPA